VKTHLDADHHVEVALRVLLNHITHVVGLSRLLKLPPRHKVLDFPYRANRITMCLRQSASESSKVNFAMSGE
jgi:hypothetical protein